MFFRCRVCAEKDARIADLKETIRSLREQLSPNTQITLQTHEADAILSARSDIIVFPDDGELNEAERIDAEAGRLLGGGF